MLRDGMQMAAARSGRGQREIEPFAIQAGAEGGFVANCFWRVSRAVSRAWLGGVQQLAEAGPLFGRQFAHLLADLGEPPLRPSASTRTASNSAAFWAAAMPASERDSNSCIDWSSM